MKHKIKDIKYIKNKKYEDRVINFLNNPLGRAYFSEYLLKKKQHSLVDFWGDVLKHEKIKLFDEKTKSEKELFKKYFETGSSNLNLGSTVNKSIKEKLNKNDSNAFDEAKDAIVDIILVYIIKILD